MGTNLKSVFLSYSLLFLRIIRPFKLQVCPKVAITHLLCLSFLFQKGKPVALFKHHTAPITSVEWHPSDSSVFAASGSDDQITLWDLAVEKDPDASSEPEPDVPPQLLFIHQGQTDIKELHWHQQLTGVIISTAHSGFNIFRTISV